MTFVYACAPRRIAAAVERDDQRGGDVLAVDPVDLALLRSERVADDQGREPLDPRVGHYRPFPTANGLDTRDDVRVGFISAHSRTAKT